MEATQVEEGLTLTVIHEDDNLAHRFCLMCEIIDKKAGRKPTPYCGKEKKGPWVKADDTDLRCIVCNSMILKPCSRCGVSRY